MAHLVDDLAIGQMNDYARVDRQVLTADGHGGHTVSWTPRVSVWVSIEPLSYREAIQAAAVQSALSTAVTTWYRDDIAITDRIVVGSRTFQIQSLQDPTGWKVALRMLCVELQA